MPFISATGDSQVLDFLNHLKRDDFKAFTQFQKTLRPFFEERGPLTGEPYWRPEGDALSAIAFKHYRIYCSVESDRRIVMYHAVEKRWPKFRDGDRQQCKKGRKDLLSDQYDEENRSLLYLANQQRRKRVPS